jgi:hypothetical protein
MSGKANTPKPVALLTIIADPMAFNDFNSCELVEVTDRGGIGRTLWEAGIATSSREVSAAHDRGREVAAERGYEILHVGRKPRNMTELRHFEGEVSGLLSDRLAAAEIIAASASIDGPKFTAADVEAEIEKYRDKIIDALKTRATGYDVEAMAMPEGFWLKWQIAGRAREARAIARLLVPGSEPEVEVPGEGGIMGVTEREHEPMPTPFAERLAAVQESIDAGSVRSIERIEAREITPEPLTPTELAERLAEIEGDRS